ncbi:hypothetical protein [Mycolicibacterium stellerae]|uniref:hypothetical protein n=1 Tax=Mycolicibacterium stellerae TaxID=2358193 RepID=UPI0013DE5963|nr:hypothetical protein [Mycolicibacterium stellerae]
MTSPVEPEFTAPLAMLTLYGALDLAVAQALESGDSETATTIDRYMPGAIENVGWSQRMFQTLLPQARRTPEVDLAVTEGLNGLLNFDKEHFGELTIPDLSNLVYIIGTLKHVPAAAPLENANLMAEALTLAAPKEGFSPEQVFEKSLAFLEGDLDDGFQGWSSWPEFIKWAAAPENAYVLELVGEVPQCRPGVITVNGLECVVVDADIDSDEITFDNLTNVMDPRNWPHAYPAFFCTMAPGGDRYPPDGWANVIETVGLCGIIGGYTLKQRLRFIKTDQRKGDARLDFDLAAKQDDCDQKVLVDRGYINARCTREDGDTSKGGVRLETRKVAHITDFDTYQLAFWFCRLGYGSAAMQLFFGPARKPTPPPLLGYIPWKDAPYAMEPKNELSAPLDDEPPNTPTPPGGTPPVGKIEVATKTAKALADMANFVTAKNLDLTKKWLASELKFDDLTKYGQEVGGRLASEPWRWLKDVTTPTPNGGTPAPGGETP